MKDYTSRNLTRQYKLRDKERFVENKPTKQEPIKEVETKLPYQDADLEAMHDLYQDAKRSWDNDLALDILDRRLELEAKRETERFFITQPSAEEMALKALKKGKDEGDF